MARKPIPDSGAVPVNVSAWLDELAALGKRNDEGHTMRELCELAGLSNRTMEQRLRRAQEAGRLFVGRRTVPRIDGIPAQVPVYRVLPARPGKAVK